MSGCLKFDKGTGHTSLMYDLVCIGTTYKSESE